MFYDNELYSVNASVYQIEEGVKATITVVSEDNPKTKNFTGHIIITKKGTNIFPPDLPTMLDEVDTNIYDDTMARLKSQFKERQETIIFHHGDTKVSLRPFDNTQTTNGAFGMTVTVNHNVEVLWANERGVTSFPAYYVDMMDDRLLALVLFHVEHNYRCAMKGE